jgi:hypothetical protein
MRFRRRAAALAAAAAILACQEERTTERCPGDAIATFDFVGGGELPAPPLLAGEVALPACRDVPADVAFTATIAFAGEDAAALCTNRRFAAVATGGRDGDAIDVATVTNRAILSQCGEGCLVEVRERVAGALLPDASAPARFEGALVDTVYPAGSPALCGDCPLPCVARYAIRSVEPEASLDSPAVSTDPSF